ncbi:MAG: pyridoxal-dependent decarboxylase [Longimicrobiales bacterium]|nr:pyridoxal-dependent decarboxylase [Longimicrobiales bacterium]
MSDAPSPESSPTNAAFGTLDPADPAEWEVLRTTLHQAADRLLDQIRDQRELPVWQEMPEVDADLLARRLGRTGAGTAEAWRTLEEHILPFGVGNVHPRFMGWVNGAGTPGGLLSAMAEATINANVGGRNSGAARVERAVLAWARGIFGFPDSASGILTSGTSMATVIALAAARQALAGWDIEEEGLGERGSAFRVYASNATHRCVESALRLLGLGRRALTSLETDGLGRLSIDALRERIAEDRAAGLRPLAVIGNAGTVDVGAIDDLTAIARVCDEERLWFHVDGAFGALAMLSETLRPRLAGIERADSIAFDFHKWMHVTYDCGCVLVRNETHHRAAFHSRPAYLEGQASGLAAGEPWFCDYGPELSRGFRALRVWFLLAEHGSDAVARAIEGCVAGADHLATRVDAEPELERMAPTCLNIVCFRVRPREGEDPDAFNAAIVAEVQRRGIAAPSTTRIRGSLAIRCCLMNHRTTREDLDLTLEGILQVAEELRRGG